MEIHKPKAAHSLAEFGREMGAVILGILIALGLEQSVEAYHWRERVKEAHQALAGEIALQVNTYNYRTAVHPCVERRLGELEAILSDLDHGRHVAPVADFARPSGSNSDITVWHAIESAGVAAHFDTAELVRYGRFYAVANLTDSWATLAGQDWATIKLLVGDPNRLTPETRANIQTAINHTRSLDGVWGNMSKVQLDRARELGVEVPPLPDVSGTAECQAIRRG